MFFKKFSVGNNSEIDSLEVRSTSELLGKAHFGRGLRGRDEAEDEIGVGGYYAKLLLGIFDEKNNNQSMVFIPGYNGHMAGCPANILQNPSSGTSYPFYNFGDISYGGKLPNGSIIYFGFCGKKSAGAAGYPSMYIYRTDWSWNSIVGINDESWKTAMRSATISGTETSYVRLSIYHMTSGSSGTSYARGTFASFNTHPWGDRYTG